MENRVRAGGRHASGQMTGRSPRPRSVEAREQRGNRKSGHDGDEARNEEQLDQRVAAD
jgi:hypothetical protein